MRPEHYPEAVVIRLAALAALLPLLLATRSRQALRYAEWIGVGVFVVLTVATAAIMPLFDGPADPQYAIQGTGVVLCILGAGLLLPLGVFGMLAFGLFSLAVHLAFTWHYPLAQNLPELVATLCSIVIATAGAGELTRSRRADFEGRHAKEELLRTRSDFVAMLTHDIKNPLAVIDGFVTMLRDEPDTPRAARLELLANVQRAVRTAISLAVDFLDASKIDAGRFVLTTRVSDVDELLQRAIADHAAHAAQHGVRLQHDGAGGLPKLDADPRALDRVFANLIGNAIKHTPPGGVVRLATRADGDRIEIVVEDTGGGIALGHEARIFERYTGAASRADSTGLGLFIARTIVVAHGGTISAENRGDRQGARFRVVLPALAV